MAQVQIVGTVEHSAVGITASVNQIVARFFGSRNKHARSVKKLCNLCFGGLRSKVSKEHDQSIASGRFYLVNGFEHVLFVFNSCLCFVETSL